jgi:hypothetical protein
MDKHAMIDRNIGMNNTLFWLLSRLVWPALMVRERACVEIATLLTHPQEGKAVQDALLTWIATQQLESVAAIGVLPFLYAQMQNERYHAPVTELVNALHVPSLLAWLLLNELDGEHTLSLDQACQYTETAPRDFRPDPFFARYVKNFLPPAYVDRVRFLEQQSSLPTWKQWSYEWHLAMKRLNLTPSRRELDDWHRRFPDGERYAGVDMMLSEVYRSAYLRMLAWARNQGIPSAVLQYFSAITCPVDLDLWKVAPQRKPEWWPHIQRAQSQFDMIELDIWQQVETLWRQNWIEPNKSAIMAACGVLCHHNVFYHLEITGFFQRRIGPNAPALADVADWHNSTKNARETILTIHRPSLLRFSGSMTNMQSEFQQQRLADWILLSAIGPAEPAAVHRWQMWRLDCPIWLPAPHLSGSPLKVICQTDAIVAQNDTGEIGRWRDWGDGLSEVVVEGLPSKSGQVLHISRNIIEQFARQKEIVFCWLCQLTRYSKESERQEWISSTIHHIYGGDQVH